MYDHEVFPTRPLQIQNFSGAALGASQSTTPYSIRITIRLQDFVAVSERISIQLAKVPVVQGPASCPWARLCQPSLVKSTGPLLLHQYARVQTPHRQTGPSEALAGHKSKPHHFIPQSPSRCSFAPCPFSFFLILIGCPGRYCN